MLSINIICIGKIKETYLKDAIAEYSKRLQRFCNLTITELQDEKLPNKINNNIVQNIKDKECEKVVQALKKDSYIFCLDLNGKEYTSENFSRKIDEILLNYNSNITFIIGGTLGLNKHVLSLSNEKICFSKMTFPHQLIRLFLLEQLFRSFKISNNETYHW